MAGSSIIAILCFTLGIVLFKNKQTMTQRSASFAPIEKILANKYYIDEMYQLLILNPLAKSAKVCAEVIDRLGIDGAVNGVGSGARRMSQQLKVLQNGDVQTAALWMIAGTALAVVGIIVLTLI
jgi:NADH-quinone oxidoreductase subunit L